MCKVKDINECEKRVFVHLKSGKQYSSDWFIDKSEKADEAVNATSAELKIYDEVKKKYQLKDEVIDRWSVNRKKDDDTVYLSKHAFERMKARAGFNKKTAVRMTKRIYDNGKRIDEVSGKTRKWIRDRIALHPGEADEYVVYGNLLYIFNQKIMITVLNMPGNMAA